MPGNGEGIAMAPMKDFVETLPYIVIKAIQNILDRNFSFKYEEIVWFAITLHRSPPSMNNIVGIT
jgi:hypothetical protein